LEPWSFPLYSAFLNLVHDLAGRFADGRLSTEKLLKATDEELSEMLIQIYGVGKVRFGFMQSAHLILTLITVVS